MTSPQDPWQQGNPQQGGYQQGYPQQYPQAGPPQYGSPPGGFPQQGGYQHYPQPYSQVSQYEGARPPRPVTIEIAFWIAIIVPLLATVLSAVAVFLLQGVTGAALDSGLQSGAMDPESQEAARSMGKTVLLVGYSFGIFMYAVLTGLWMLFGFKMRAGRNWARITLTVFAGIWLLISVSGLVSGGGAGVSSMPSMQTGPVLAMGYVQSGLALVAMAAFLVLVWIKQSNLFFAANRYRR